MIRLSVNVNKVATLRNSRGGHAPDVLEAVEVCIAAGAPGITVHPRADRRHITPADVREIARALAGRAVEFNIEGDPRPELIDLVERGSPGSVHARPCRRGRDHQPGRLAARSADGWTGVMWCGGSSPAGFASACSSIRCRRRSSGRHRSAPTASSSTPNHSPARSSAEREAGLASFETTPRRRAWPLHSGLGINAGHDLDLANLTLFRRLPFLDEVSIGHAIISRALFVGLDTVVREYLDVLAAA